MNTVEELKRLVATIDALAAKVDEVVAPKASPTKRIPFFSAQSVLFHAPEFSLKERTYVNGAEDLFVTKLGFAAQKILDSTAPASSLNDNEVGLGAIGGVTDNFFDFTWNYRLASTGSQYLSSANNTFLTSRKSLGNKDRGRFLEFDAAAPLIIRAGDAITFSVRSILYPVPLVGVNYMVAVNLLMIGYRNGQMAEAAYEIGGRKTQPNVGGRRV